MTDAAAGGHPDAETLDAESPNTETLDAETVNAMVRELFPSSTSQCVELGPSAAVAAMVVDPADLRPGGYVSGPTQFALADSALWYLTFGALGRVEPMALTSELSIRFLRPAIGERLVCRAVLESISRRSAVGTFHVWCDGRPDKITATGQGTYAVPM